MQHLPQNCLIHPPIEPEKPVHGQPDEGARVEEGIKSSSRDTFLGTRKGDGAAGDGSRHSWEPLAAERSQNGSGVLEDVRGVGSRSGSVEGDCRCVGESRCGRRGVITSTKSTGEIPAKIVEILAKSVPVESIPGEFVELTPAALAEETSKPPVDSVVAASEGLLVNTSLDPTHAAQERKGERLGNSAQVTQPTRVSELQLTGTPKSAGPEPLRNEGTLTALLGGYAVTPQTIPQSLPKFLVDPILVSPGPPVDHLAIVPLTGSINEPVARHLPTEPTIMEPVTELVAETATKPDIESVSDIVSGPVSESAVPKVPDIEIPRTPSLSVVPPITPPHIQLSESIGPVPQETASGPEPSPIVPPSGSVGIETALQAPLPFDRPSHHFAVGFIRNRFVSKLLRSLKRRVLPKKNREDKTPNLLPIPSSPVRPSLEDAAPTQTKTPVPPLPTRDPSSLDDGGGPRISTAEICAEDAWVDRKSLPTPLPNPSTPLATHLKKTIPDPQSRHPATQVAYRRAAALRALELRQIREDELEVARLRGGGCCGGDGGGKSIDPTPHQAGTGLPLPTEKPPVAPPPLVTPRTPKPGEQSQGDPPRSRTQSQTAPQRSRAQSHASQRTNKPGAESRSRRGSQATLKEAPSVSRQPSQREIRSRTTSQAEPRSRKQSRVGESGTSSQTRGARSRTTSKAPAVPPLPSTS